MFTLDHEPSGMTSKFKIAIEGVDWKMDYVKIEKLIMYILEKSFAKSVVLVRKKLADLIIQSVIT